MKTKEWGLGTEGAFHSWATGRFHLNFPNRNTISIVFGEGTYSENHDSNAETDYLLGRTNKRPVFDSATCEIMFNCPDKLQKKIEKKYNDGATQPLGHISLPQCLEIINLLAK